MIRRPVDVIDYDADEMEEVKQEVDNGLLEGPFQEFNTLLVQPLNFSLTQPSRLLTDE